MPRPVTLADIARSGVLLLVWCRCGHRAELSGDAIPLPRSTPILGIENRLRCTACGARNTSIDHPVQAVMDPRRPGK